MRAIDGIVGNGLGNRLRNHDEHMVAPLFLADQMPARFILKQMSGDWRMDDYISASEIGEYLFCQRAWWLRLHGVMTTHVEMLEQGASALGRKKV